MEILLFYIFPFSLFLTSITGYSAAKKATCKPVFYQVVKSYPGTCLSGIIDSDWSVVAFRYFDF